MGVRFRTTTVLSVGPISVDISQCFSVFGSVANYRRTSFLITVYSIFVLQKHNKRILRIVRKFQRRRPRDKAHSANSCGFSRSACERHFSVLHNLIIIIQWERGAWNVVCHTISLAAIVVVVVSSNVLATPLLECVSDCVPSATQNVAMCGQSAATRLEWTQPTYRWRSLTAFCMNTLWQIVVLMITIIVIVIGPVIISVVTETNNNKTTYTSFDGAM